MFFIYIYVICSFQSINESINFMPDENIITNLFDKSKT